MPSIPMGAVSVNPSDKSVLLLVGGLVVIVALGYFGIYRPILQKFGLVDDKDDRINDRLTGDLESSTAFLQKKNPSGATISEDKAMGLAKDIYDAMGTWITNDCEECVYGAILNAGSKKNMQVVSYWFYQNHNQDLLGYLQNYFNHSELAEVQKRVNKL